MAENRRVPIMLARRLEYELPADLEWVGIVHREGAEGIRIRFSRYPYVGGRLALLSIFRASV